MLDYIKHLKTIEDKSVDLIIHDFSFTSLELWTEYKRIRKDNTPIIFFGNEPFLSSVRLNNIKEYRYDWYYNQNGTINSAAVFYKKLPNYIPQMIKKDKAQIRKAPCIETSTQQKLGVKTRTPYNNNGYYYPDNLLLNNDPKDYFIKIYSQKGDYILINSL